VVADREKKKIGFAKNPELINRKGRRKLLIGEVASQLIKKGYTVPTKDTITKTILLLLQLPKEEIINIANDTTKEQHPYFTVLIAETILGRNKAEVMEKLLDRTIGKAVQTVDFKVAGELKMESVFSLQGLDREELLKLKEISEKVRKNNKQS